MTSIFRRSRLPFHTIAGLVFVGLTLLVGGSIGAFAYWQQRQLLLSGTQDRFERSARETFAELQTLLLPVQAQLAVLVNNGRAQDLLTGQRLFALVQVFESNPGVLTLEGRGPEQMRWTLYTLPDSMARQAAHAPPEAAYRLDQSDASGFQHTRFFTERLSPLPLAPQPFSTPAPPDDLVIHYGWNNPVGGIRARISLKYLAGFLSPPRATHTAQMALADHQGRLIASTQGAWFPVTDGEPPLHARQYLTLFTASMTAPELDHLHRLEHAGQYWQTLVTRAEPLPGMPMSILLAAPDEEVFASADILLRRSLLITGLILLFALPVIWWLARKLSHSLRALAKTAAEARAFRFPEAADRSSVREVDELAATLYQMGTTIQRFLDISERLAAEREFDRLLSEIVAQSMVVAAAGGGVVYLNDPQQGLVPKAWRSDSPRPDKIAQPVAVSDIHSRLIEWFQPLTSPRCERLIAPVLPGGLDWLAAWFPGQSIDLLLVPLINREGARLGLLLLARAPAPAGFSPDVVDFVGALAGTLAITIEKQQLLTGRQALLDGIIRMIAGAIDARSPYTSAHCQRVPIIVALLADAVAKHPDSPFQSTNEETTAHTREALHLAAWLHDCGKLFVPDYITDKSVKLEAIHNRIHEIRTRFEVLKRDAEIACWREIAAGGDASALQRQLKADWSELDDEFAFIARCNQGDPALSDADIARLARIGARRWLRTLDDHLGISAEELQRKALVPPRPLPAQEHLLADRMEHLIGDYPGPSGHTTHTNLRTPRHRLNLGELYCLSVRSGTLTAEERYLINAHILGTISMLSNLPFPSELAGVPDIAGSHHEHLDGSGYPFGRQAAELPLAARIIAIADVFEALTATDRPYKAGKTEAEALDIMADMARLHHLDADLLALFIKADIPAQLHQTVTKLSPSST